MGANISNINAIKGALDFSNGGLPVLEGFVEQVPYPALVINDLQVAYIGATGTLTGPAHRNMRADTVQMLATPHYISLLAD